MPNHFSFYTSYDVLLFSIKSPQRIKSVSNIRKKLKKNTIFFWDKDLKHKSAALRYIFFCISRLKERGGGRESSIVNQKREKYKIYVMFPCSGRFKKKWISPVLSDRTPFRLERQQRSFKSDSGLGSEFEIGRRNSRGHACPLVPSRGFYYARVVHVSGIDSFMNGDHTWFERSVPIRSIPLPRGS